VVRPPPRVGEVEARAEEVMPEAGQSDMVPVQAQPIAQSPWGQTEYNEGHSTPGLRVNLIPSAGDQNIMIPQLWPSRQFDPSIVWIKPLDPQGSGIQTGRRDNLVPQYWGSNHSDPEALAFASIRSLNCGDQSITSTR
jgi:hypothetical protein